jgi:signal transduction histidine kinase
VGTPYGFSLNPNSTAGGQRSAQVVSQPVYDLEGNMAGYVELSEGPAYGRDVLTSVAWGWSMASAIAVLLAAVAGWVVSRRLSQPLLTLTEITRRMSGGDLSARANIGRQDELGLLGHSFNKMAQRIEETVTALRRFIADAAHELTTPLTALHTDLELIAGQARDAEQLARVKRAQSQLDRLEGLTAGLLDLSRIEAGAAGNGYNSLNLNDLVQHSSEVYAARAEQRNIDFALALPAAPIMIWGHEDQLRQAVINLLDNALKFTPPGGRVNVERPAGGAQFSMWLPISNVRREPRNHLPDR